MKWPIPLQLNQYTDKGLGYVENRVAKITAQTMLKLFQNQNCDLAFVFVLLFCSPMKWPIPLQLNQYTGKGLGYVENRVAKITVFEVIEIPH